MVRRSEQCDSGVAAGSMQVDLLDQPFKRPVPRLPRLPQATLDTLASPLLAVLDGSKEEGYRVTTSSEAVRRRVETVAQQLSTSSSKPERSDQRPAILPNVITHR